MLIEKIGKKDVENLQLNNSYSGTKSFDWGSAYILKKELSPNSPSLLL